eukprot:jgi/Psemu1/288529/fgenesh1_pg.269_\
MYQFALNPSGYLDILGLFLPAISSMLAMMSIAFSPWIIYATISPSQTSSINFFPASSEQPSTFAASTSNYYGKQMRSSLHEVDDVTKVDNANQFSGRDESKKTTIRNCVEQNVHKVVLPQNRLYNKEERSPLPAIITDASTANDQFSPASPNSTVESPVIITPKRNGLATNVIFRGATLHVETSRSLKRKVSHYVPSSEESDSNDSSCERQELQPKKKKLESPLSTKKKPNKENSLGLKTPVSNKKTLLSDRRFRRIEEKRVQRKKKSKTKNWMTMYDKLVSFKEQHNGSTVIPWSNRDSELQQLGYWIRDQKRKLRTNKLSRNHADLLRSIGIT